jgi:thiol-disulfide isomerase/thioredoxin
MNRSALQHAPQSARKQASHVGAWRIGPADDAFEQEADEAAERITFGDGGRLSWSLSRVGFGPLQRECTCGGTCEDCKGKTEHLQRNASGAAASPAYAPPSIGKVLSRPGSAMDGATRAFMESRFGYDFGRVRIHHDDEAAASARDVSANAYTVGSSIVFDRGKYAPNSNTGRRLLAHELSHVVQQSRGTAATRVQLQRQAASPQTVQTATPAGDEKKQNAAASCIHELKGNDFSTILRPKTVAVIEFTASWCEPCQNLAKKSLEPECEKYRNNPDIQVEFYSIDIDLEENKDVVARLAKGGPPHLYIYAGTEQKYYNQGYVEPQFFTQLLAKIVADASASKTDAKSGKSGLSRPARAGIFAGGGLALAGIGLGIAAALGPVGLGAVLGVLALGAAAGFAFGYFDPLGLFKRKSPVGPDEADKLIGDRFGSNLQKAIAGSTLSGKDLGLPKCKINVVQTKEFCEAYVAKHTDPSNSFIAMSAKSECERQDLHAWVDFDTQPATIWIDADRRDPGTLIHEGLHLYSSKAIRQRSASLNEGATEYFTREITDDPSVNIKRDVYEKELEQVKELVGITGEGVMRNAYFKGAVDELVKALDRIRGEGTFEQWEDAMEKEQWDLASKKLRGID